MTCYSPIQAYKPFLKNENGKFKPIFKYEKGSIEMTIPCGQCFGCRLRKTQEWAIRLMHEARQYPEKCYFVTLTYAPEHLPKNESVDIRDFQLFMKRLRKRYGNNIRFFHCGEYGIECQNCGKSKFKCECGNFVKQLGRPHYHAIIFGHTFEDKELHKYDKSTKVRLYKSEILAKSIWKKGHCIIGDVSIKSCGYVARYVLKKITGEKQEQHYEKINRETGELHVVKPEYISMSTKPGIGHHYIQEYWSDVYSIDSCRFDGKDYPVPRYYDKIYEEKFPEDMKKIKTKRKEDARKKQIEDPTSWQREKQKEFIKRKQLTKCIRAYEEESC